MELFFMICQIDNIVTIHLCIILNLLGRSSILRIHFFQITIEPPQGLRANLLVAYQSKPINEGNFYNQAEGGGNGRQLEFQRLIYGLCFFHGVVLERHRYGPAGWNNRYAFNMSDLGISLKQMKEILFKVRNQNEIFLVV